MSTVSFFAGPEIKNKPTNYVNTGCAVTLASFEKVVKKKLKIPKKDTEEKYLKASWLPTIEGASIWLNFKKIKTAS